MDTGALQINWQVKLGDKALRLEDIPIGVLREVGQPYEQDWIRLIYYPLVDERATKALVIKVAEILGVNPPAPPEEDWPARLLIDAFETVPDDMPDTVDGDGLQIGRAHV